jgi:hypothetical protein
MEFYFKCRPAVVFIAAPLPPYLKLELKIRIITMRNVHVVRVYTGHIRYLVRIGK